MGIEVKTTNTLVKYKHNEEEGVIAEQRWISKNACYGGDKSDKTLVEMKWWGPIRDFEQYDKADEWCKKQCEGWFYSNQFGGRFEFDLRSDAVKFKMVWG